MNSQYPESQQSAAQTATGAAAGSPVADSMPVGMWHAPILITENNFIYKSLSNWALNVAVGCWGELDLEDRRQNELALERGSILVSIFRASNGTRFYVITEGDRSVTTVLLPEEY